MDAVEPVGIDKESIAQTLQEYVDSPDVRVKFAWGRKLANEEFLESMLVEGIGEINIPISKEALSTQPQHTEESESYNSDSEVEIIEDLVIEQETSKAKQKCPLKTVTKITSCEDSKYEDYKCV